jgi:hypothetical protein
MVAAARAFPAESLDRVVFAVFGDDAYDAFVSATLS